jgi:predicted DCC family thiol-disulfide oxidoreductase YuxK
MKADRLHTAVILYDGICGLCNRFVKFVLRRDRDDAFQFAPLQSDFARDLLRQHGLSPDDLDTVYLVLGRDGPREQILARSEAVAEVLRRLGGTWKLAGRILERLPRPARGLAYRMVASNRYRLFGRYNTCPLPSEPDRRKFIAT